MSLKVNKNKLKRKYLVAYSINNTKTNSREWIYNIIVGDDFKLINSQSYSRLTEYISSQNSKSDTGGDVNIISITSMGVNK
jgi:hypothetical protein